MASFYRMSISSSVTLSDCPCVVHAGCREIAFISCYYDLVDVSVPPATAQSLVESVIVFSLHVIVRAL